MPGAAAKTETFLQQIHAGIDAKKHWIGWHDLNPDVKTKLVQQILAQVKSARAEGAVKGGATGTGAAASTASRTAGATSRFTAMYSRLRTLKGETTSLSNDVTTWFETTQSDLAEFNSPTARNKALVKLGILGQRDFVDFNRLFKASAGYQKATGTRDALDKAEHKRKQLDATMKFIEEHTLPSQKERNVLGTEGEVERLLTVLWHDLTAKAATKGHRDDDSDQSQ
jgi:hypothetical protein